MTAEDLKRIEDRTEIWLDQGQEVRLHVIEGGAAVRAGDRGHCRRAARLGRCGALAPEGRRGSIRSHDGVPRRDADSSSWRAASPSASPTSALQDVDIDVYEGEVLALVGDNGAGKSTLIKILCGVHQPDRGEIKVAGQPTRITDPHKARELGIATVFQNLALVDLRDVAANLYLGREPVRWRWFVDRKKMLEGARKVLADLRVNMPSLTAEVGQLSGGQRQSIAIGRATSQHGRIIIMDEPTAALGVKESRKVLDLILRLKAAGTGVVIVSHNMRHVFSVADRIAGAPPRPQRRRAAASRDHAGRDRQDDRRHRDG